MIGSDGVVICFIFIYFENLDKITSKFVSLLSP